MSEGANNVIFLCSYITAPFNFLIHSLIRNCLPYSYPVLPAIPKHVNHDSWCDPSDILPYFNLYYDNLGLENLQQSPKDSSNGTEMGC